MELSGAGNAAHWARRSRMMIMINLTMVMTTIMMMDGWIKETNTCLGIEKKASGIPFQWLNKNI